MNCKYCNSENIIKFGTHNDIQRYYCKDCQRKFVADTLHKMQTPVNQVSASVGMYYNGLSLSEIGEMLKQIYKNDVTDYGIYKWVARFTKDAIQITKNYKPNVGYVWMADETVIKVGGKQYWLVDVLDIKTRFLIASHLSPYRRVEDIQECLTEAYNKTGIIPKVIMTDSLHAYQNGIVQTFGNKTKHLKVLKFTENPNNNLIERMQGTIKRRTKIMRDLKSTETARTIINGYLINYNFFRPHETLSRITGNDTTPAERAGIEFPYSDWEALIKHSQHAKNQIMTKEFIPVLPKVQLTAKQKKKALERKYKRRDLYKQRAKRAVKAKERHDAMLVSVRIA